MSGATTETCGLLATEECADLPEDLIGMCERLPPKSSDLPPLGFEQALAALLGLDRPVDGIDVGAVLATAVELDADARLRHCDVDEVPLAGSRHRILCLQPR